MGAMDLVLKWGEGNALTEAAGDVEVNDLAAGASRVVWVDHSAHPLALWSDPVFSLEEGDVGGLTLTVLTRGKDAGGEYRATDGTGFLLKVEVAADAVGQDKGRGSSGWDWDLTYTRRGVAV